MKINHLVLASTSVHRRALLDQVGITHEAQAPTADEALVHANDPMALALARSEAKGLSLAFAGLPFLAIAADQVLEFRGRAYGKAATRDAAGERLRMFAGHEHSLHSAYTLVLYTEEQPRIVVSRVVSAQLRMRSLTEAEIEAYLTTDEWRGCAGCYQYENRGMNLFSTVTGDLSTIIGLPLPALLQDLRTLGIDVLVQPKGPWDLQSSTGR